MGTDKKCRWGILGTSTIGRKNWDSIRNTGNAVVTAVASRDRGRAQSYIEELQRDRPFEHVPAACKYEELLARDDVDAVYIPLPTGVRSDWVIKAAQAGKHVM
jgi:predicted dehydrogenase